MPMVYATLLDQAAKPGKYVPPSMRNRVPGEEGGFRERRDDSSTVRVTNLSETTNEEDLRALVFRIGPVARVVSRLLTLLIVLTHL